MGGLVSAESLLREMDKDIARGWRPNNGPSQPMLNPDISGMNINPLAPPPSAPNTPSPAPPTYRSCHRSSRPALPR